MNTPPNFIPEAIGSVPGTPAITRPFYWSVRRELWEYRSIYLAPLAIAGVIVFSNVFVLNRLPGTMRTAMTLDPMKQHDAIAQHFEITAALIMGVAFLVSIFYALDTLYGERRDRSILFWKSLPVSDLTTVLAKACVPLLIVPVVAFVITTVTEAILLLLSSAVLAANGLSVSTFWAILQPFPVLGMLAYHLVTVHILWYAPLYAWLLLVSAWARRAPFLWVVIPPLAVGIFEKIAFHSSHFSDWLQYRVSGGGHEAVDSMNGDMPFHPGVHLTPLDFLATPGLWLGLFFAAVFLIAAARMRRAHGPN